MSFYQWIYATPTLGLGVGVAETNINPGLQPRIFFAVQQGEGLSM